MSGGEWIKSQLSFKKTQNLKLVSVSTVKAFFSSNQRTFFLFKASEPFPNKQQKFLSSQNKNTEI